MLEKTLKLIKQTIMHILKLFYWRKLYMHDNLSNLNVFKDIKKIMIFFV